jgi:hypothetical protein
MKIEDSFRPAVMLLLCRDQFRLCFLRPPLRQAQSFFHLDQGSVGWPSELGREVVSASVEYATHFYLPILDRPARRSQTKCRRK